MKEEEVNKKIEDILNSVDYINSAEANPFLLTRVIEQIKTYPNIHIQPIKVWQITAVLMFLITVNIGIIFFSGKNNSKVEENTSSEYFTNYSYNY